MTGLYEAVDWKSFDMPQPDPEVEVVPQLTIAGESEPDYEFIEEES